MRIVEEAEETKTESSLANRKTAYLGNCLN
jgi:hypothetical protein